MSFNTLDIVKSLSLLVFVGLSTCLSYLANDSIFIGSSFIYILLLFGVSTIIDCNFRNAFITVVAAFLTFYSLYACISHYVLIQSAFHDYFVNVDATGYIKKAIAISKFNYFKIWHVSFTQFQYSQSPLFYVWIGMLQKISTLNSFYSLLFQKLNVAFLGSFIPGIVYLLCNRITYKKHAFKAAIVYGLLTFTFFYSVGFMRDIHIALIYGITLLILTGNSYNFKNLLLLIILGIVAFYIRLENGLFFLAFIAIWLYKSGNNNKFLLVLGSVACFTGAIFAIGGIGTIYNMAFGTIESYRQRAVLRASQGSLGIQLAHLPIPINYIGMTAFGQISPFPFWFKFRDGLSVFKNIFYLPQAFAGLFWFAVWVRIIRYPQKAYKFFQQYKPIILTVILYLVVVSIAQPGSRRLMAVYPVIFMAYIYISKNIFKVKELLITTSIYSFLLLIYFSIKV